MKTPTITATPQQFADLKGSNQVVIGVTRKPGKIYFIKCNDESIKVKCTQNFGPPMKSHFKIVIP